VRVLFATAELAPEVKVGGLGDFSAGLTRILRSEGVEIDLVLPDYGGLPFEPGAEHDLDVPDWASPARIRQGILGDVEVGLVSVPEIARANPYLDAKGRAWDDNDLRFFAFSAAVAAWIRSSRPDVVHLNDWHTAATLAFLDEALPTIFTIHNLAYQGQTDVSWLDRFPRHADPFRHGARTNPMAGGITLADRVVTVSPRFAEESLPPNDGFGLADLLQERGDSFLGILNGIDTQVWDPATDQHLPINYDLASFDKKQQVRSALVEGLGWEETETPLIGMVTRLTEQKGVDIALETLPALEALGARMVLLGSGERSLAEMCARNADRYPDRFAFREGYDEGLAHRIFAGCDLYLMPSRFEPAGLTQMQAMRYGTIPVVTDVGGLHDSVIDADAQPELGNGFVAAQATPEDVTDSLTRAVDAWRSPRRRRVIVRNGMTADWSWNGPAQRYIDLYREVMSAR
jgi:starch synthase